MLPHPAVAEDGHAPCGAAGAPIAVATTPFLPAGIPVVLAALGVVARYPLEKKAVTA